MMLTFLFTGDESLAIVPADSIGLDSNAVFDDPNTIARLAEINALNEDCFFIPTNFQEQAMLFIKVSLLMADEVMSRDSILLVQEALEGIPIESLRQINAEPLVKLTAVKL